MTILIWGAGAVGGTVGAFLARAGHDVRFVDIVPEHVTAIAEHGLAIEGPIEAFSVDVPAFLPDGLEGRFERIFLATKAQATVDAARALLPHLADDGYVLSLQNGLNEEAIAAIVGRQRTIGAFINFGADYLEPGRILYGGRGAVVVGELDGRTTPRLLALLEILKDFDEAAVMTPDIEGYLWGKLGYGALLFATALTDASIADVLASGRHRPVLTRLAAELDSAARAQGIEPLGFNGYEPALFCAAAGVDATPSFEAMVAHNRKSAKTHSGIWRDLAVRKRRTEVDPQLTRAVAAGRKAGVAMPLTTRLIGLIQAIERGELPLAWSTLDKLGEGA